MKFLLMEEFSKVHHYNHLSQIMKKLNGINFDRSQNLLNLSVVETSLVSLNAKKLSGSASIEDHKEWIKSKMIITCARIAEVNTISMLAKEKVLKIEEYSIDFF